MSKELQKVPPSANATLMENFKGEVQKVTPYLKTLLGNDDMVDRFVKMTHLALMRDPKLLQADGRGPDPRAEFRGPTRGSHRRRRRFRHARRQQTLSRHVPGRH